MQDTRTTNIWHELGNKSMNTDNSRCRFNIGDKVLTPRNAKLLTMAIHTIFWDKSFGGWLVCPAGIGIHEQNFILESEHEQWEPHEDGLWSYWTRKEATCQTEKEG